MHERGVVGEQKQHRQAVDIRRRAADGHQRVHVGAQVAQGLEAADVKAPADVHDARGEQQLHQREVHGVRVHVDYARQRRAEHGAHGDIEQHGGERQRGDDAVALAAEGGLLRLFLGVEVLFLLLFGVQRTRAVARLFDLGDDLLRRHLALVILDGHAVHGEVDVAARDALHAAGDALHRGRAGRAVHALYEIGFGFQYTTPGYFSFVRIIYPGGVFVKPQNARGGERPRARCGRQPSLQARIWLRSQSHQRSMPSPVRAEMGMMSIFGLRARARSATASRSKSK